MHRDLVVEADKREQVVGTQALGEPGGARRSGLELLAVHASGPIDDQHERDRRAPLPCRRGRSQLQHHVEALVMVDADQVVLKPDVALHSIPPRV